MLAMNTYSTKRPPAHPGGRPGRGFGRAAFRVRRLLAAAGLCLAGAWALGAGSAGATVTHPFLRAFEEGPPAGQPIAGPLSGVDAITINAGHLWIAERINSGPNLSRSRIDAFDDSTGAFIPPQLDEEDGVIEMRGGVAVHEQKVYVVARREHKFVLAVFGPGGTLEPEGVWSGANTPNKNFGDEITGVAVSENIETQGDVYVASRSNGGGIQAVYVFPPDVDGHEPAEAIGELTQAEKPFIGPQGVAVAPNGDLVVADGVEEQCVIAGKICTVNVFEPMPGSPGKFTFLRSLTGPPGRPFKHIGPVAADAEGNVYVVEEQAGVVDQFNGAGEFVGQLTGTPEGPFEGRGLAAVAVDQSSGDLFVSNVDPTLNVGSVYVFGPSQVVPDVTTEPATSVQINGQGFAEATFNGLVNPDDEGPATCDFEWGATAAFGHTTSCEHEVPNGSTPVEVSAQVEGLAPDATYEYQLQATNKNGTNPGSGALKVATPGPGIHAESVSNVASTSATLDAAIDPNEAPTSYYFQYGRNSDYEAQVPASEQLLGEAKGDVAVSPQRIQGLSPGTTYHYRVVAVSRLVVEGKGAPQPVSFFGPDQTFTTQGVAAMPRLLDGRRWEMVSPPDKHGALLRLGEEGGITEAAADGAGVTFIATLPTEEDVKGYNYLGVQVLASRSPTGWSSEDITTAHETTAGLPIGVGFEYRYFTPDLSLSLLEPQGEFTSLAPEVFPRDTGRGPYLRHDATCRAEPGACFRPVLVGCPPPGEPCDPEVQPYADVPAGTKFGGNPHGKVLEKFVGEARFLGATASLTHVILYSRVPLTEQGTEGNPELYEWSPGSPPREQVQLVSILPSGPTPAARGVGLGFESAVMRHAVSEDGSRAFWNVALSSGGYHLYMRDLAKGVTVQLDAPEPSCVATAQCGDRGPEPHFQLAAADGSRVLFTDTQRLTADAGRVPGEADLYECAIGEEAGKPVCHISDVTPSPGSRQAADVLGDVIGASEDAGAVYFTANGVLGDAAGHGRRQGDCRLVNTEVQPNQFVEIGEGTCYLYVHSEEATHLIAEVAGADYSDWAARSPTQLSQLTARVSPNGRWLAFMSAASLTGYDNRDAVTGKPDQEVYLYHDEGPVTGGLICASCNPTGARPTGIEAGKLKVVAGEGWASEVGLAASVPGWSPYELERSLYQPRYLSNSGRLFFDSSDALVPQDVNRNEDVYEVEPAGVGGCAVGSPGFEATTGGCLALISSGVSAGESAFADASESGDDVFFLTSGQLVPADIDTATDMYDAHVCSAGEPCPEPAEAPPPCTTAEACRAAPSPQPSIFGAPASATFEGEGNFAPPASTRPAARAKPTAAQKLASALKACRKRYAKAKKRRISCESQARKRARKTTTKKRGGR